MLENVFPGYSEIALPPDDGELLKWFAVRKERAPEGWTSRFKPATLFWARLAQMNWNVNSEIAYVDDPQDVWQWPALTVHLGTGDCEDYAILKRALLIESGLPDDRCALVLGHIAAMPNWIPHAWLLVEAHGERRVFDNKFDMLIPPRRYLNWRPAKMFCAERGILFAQQTALGETHGTA